MTQQKKNIEEAIRQIVRAKLDLDQGVIDLALALEGDTPKIVAKAIAIPEKT